MNTPTSVVELLGRLIGIDSRNTLPLGAAGEREATEEAMCEAVAAHCRDLGLETEIQWVAPNRPALIAWTQPRAGLPTLAFEAHLDTVGTEGMEHDPFRAEIRDGCMYGRGACDTKGSMAAMLVAIERLLKEDALLNLMFIGACAEETGCEGAPLLDLSRWDIDGVVVGEPTSNQPVTAHKKNAYLELVCRGKAAHGSRPDLGCNAIYRMAQVIGFIQEKIAPELARHTSSDFSGSTISANCIEGGVKTNIVPDLCRVKLDLRLVPDGPDIEKILDEIPRRATETLGFTVERGETHTTPGLWTAPDDPLVKAACGAVRRLGGNSETGAVCYCTDGGVFSNWGIPTVVLGPGSIRNA
ncbi:MAG: M20/M25/M40 family metallo-hydrolase, partial [Lentisphaeria bacterium]|nr:M20/M25/M40 family metallo-hydrolase [Lentisphaeria bacterium]